MSAALRTPEHQKLARRVILQRALKLKEAEARSSRNTIIGFVCPEKGHTHSIQQAGNRWEATTQEPDIYLAAVMERAVTSNKRFIIIFGGRGSSKSVAVADIALVAAKDNGDKAYCLREYQSSIKNSIQSLLEDEAKRLPGTRANSNVIMVILRRRKRLDIGAGRRG